MTPDAPWELLFDLAAEGPPNTGWLAGCSVALLVALATLWRWRRLGRPLRMPIFFSAAFALMVSVTAFTVWDHHRLVAALQAERFLVAEGTLQSYSVEHRAHWNPSSKRYDRSIAESFYVGEVPFGFVRDASVPGYTNSGDTPLVFATGEVLRVHYVEDEPGDFASRRILRLERLHALRAGAGTFETHTPRHEAALIRALQTLESSQR